MAYHEREYDVFIIEGTENSQDIWKWQHWEPWATALAPFTESSRGKAAVRCNQYSSNPWKKVPFGKLSWEEKSYLRWTHESPVNNDNSRDWGFLAVEAWSPSWTICVRENLPPEFYFSMKNPNFNNIRDRKKSPFIVCAIPVLDNGNLLQELELTIINLVKTLPASLLAYKRRPWGITSFPGSNGFTHAIQDIYELPFSKPGNPLAKPFDEDTLLETWRLIKV